MGSIRKNLHLSGECMKNLDLIMEQTSAKSITAAIEMAATAYAENTHRKLQYADIQHQLKLIKKYSNEQRRNEYLIIDLLNAMAIHMDISAVPMHHEKTFRSPALSSAYDNLAVYMADVMTKISENTAVRGEADE